MDGMVCGLSRILEEEDNLIAAHRWQIEETMAIVRQEMNLLGQVREKLVLIGKVYVLRFMDVECTIHLAFWCIHGIL